MPLNFAEIEIRYEEQTAEAGLGSDGELVQAVSEEPYSTVGGGGRGGGKPNIENISFVKYVDTATDSLDFDLSAGDAQTDASVDPSQPIAVADVDNGLADTLVWSAGTGGSTSDDGTVDQDFWLG